LGFGGVAVQIQYYWLGRIMTLDAHPLIDSAYLMKAGLIHSAPFGFGVSR
jgi:hypothetical protein